MVKNMKHNFAKIIGGLFVGAICLCGMGRNVKAAIDICELIAADGEVKKTYNSDLEQPINVAVSEAESGDTIRMIVDTDTYNSNMYQLISMYSGISNKELILDLNGKELRTGAQSGIRIGVTNTLTITDT